MASPVDAPPREAPEPADVEAQSGLDPLDLDHDGRLSDTELALAPVPPRWKRLGLHGPAIAVRWIGNNLKRIAVAVAGFTVLAAGVAMLVLPGPGLLVIVAGFAILATEFAWAERALDKAKAKAAQAAGAAKNGLRRARRGGRGTAEASAGTAERVDSAARAE